MRRRFVSAAPFLAIAGCSALVQINDEDYLGAELPNLGGQTSGGSGDDVAPPAQGGMGGSFGIGDEVDLDGDGRPDGTLVDSNGDGIVDSVDTDGDGVGDVDFTPGASGGSNTGGTDTGGTDTGGTDTGGTTATVPEPLHYWPLDERNPRDAGTGQEVPAYVSHGDYWRETSGVTGGAYFVTNMLNDQYIGLQASATNANPATLSWWYISSIDGYIVLASKTHFTNNPPARGWALLADNAGLHFRVGGGADSQFEPVSLPAPNDGEWTHIALAYHQDISGTQDEYKIWVNGELLVKKRVVFSDEMYWDQADVRFGFPLGDATPPAIDFSGFVDEVRFYDRMLSDAEVRALYEFDIAED